MFTKSDVKNFIRTSRETGDYCICLNGFYISIEEFNPVVIGNTLYISDGINIAIDEIKEMR